jgi:DNA polymerase elongation subunit (family B)
MEFYTNVIQRGNSLLVRGVEDGQRVSKRVNYRPTLFNKVHEHTGYKTLDGQDVLPRKFDSIKEAKAWAEQRANQKILFGNTQYPYCYISDEYPNDIPWDKDQILIVTIDIEVECENGFPNPQDAAEPLLSITMKNHQNKKIVVWGLHEFQNSREDVDYRLCRDEDDLLIKFLDEWRMIYPDIITGWNTEFFDIPYICNRIKNLFGEDFMHKLSPWNNVFAKEVYQMGRKHQVYSIQGVSALDFFDLYRKFTYTNQERYTLDHIAFVELGERKDGNPFETFKEWYQKDYQSFIEYNIQDVEIVDKLEDKMRLIELCLTMAYDGKVNFTDVLGQVRYWDNVIYNHLRKKNIVIPQKKDNEKVEKFEGAYVKDPQVGMHKWVMSFDLNSLYPHLIMQYNISPETLVPDCEVKEGMVGGILDEKIRNDSEYCMTPNGAFFRKDVKGFLPEIMENVYNDRVKYKKLMLEAKQEYEDTGDPALLKKISRYDNIQMAKKISLNSAYGAIGNNYFRYFDLLVATAITTSGQLSIRWVEKSFNIYLNRRLKTTGVDYVIASDTDSVYVTFESLVAEKFKSGEQTSEIVNFLDAFAKEELEPFIDKSYEALAKRMNAYDQKMQMAREAIASTGIWTAKKRYILNVWDMEGVRFKEPYLKIMGIEAVKSSTPAPCREKIKQALKIIINGNEKELNAFIKDFREEFMNLPPEDIAYPRSCNGIGKYTATSKSTMDLISGETVEYGFFKKGAPIHTKGAILMNYLVEKNNLSAKYPFIQEGDKVKFIALKEPNKYQSSSLSFMTSFPTEFGMEDLIDRPQQFEKSFIEPLRFITDKIQWGIDGGDGRQGTLEDFFG